MKSYDLAAFVTIALLVLTEQFAQLPAAVVAFAAGRSIAARGDLTRGS